MSICRRHCSFQFTNNIRMSPRSRARKYRSTEAGGRTGVEKGRSTWRDGPATPEASQLQLREVWSWYFFASRGALQVATPSCFPRRSLPRQHPLYLIGVERSHPASHDEGEAVRDEFCKIALRELHLEAPVDHRLQHPRQDLQVLIEGGRR